MEVGEIRQVSENRWEIRGNKTMGRLLKRLTEEIPERCWEDMTKINNELSWVYYLDVEGDRISVAFRYMQDVVSEKVREIISEFSQQKNNENSDNIVNNIDITIWAQLTATDRLDVRVKMKDRNSKLWGSEMQSFAPSEWGSGKVKEWVAKVVNEMIERVKRYRDERNKVEAMIQEIANEYGAELIFSTSWDKKED